MLWTVLRLSWVVGIVWAGADDGPGDAAFKENDGDLESDVNPLKAPKGNYVIPEEDGVHVLSRDTFAHFVMPKQLVLVEFYAPWCGHCKTLEPQYSKAAKELKQDGIALAKVDATKEAELAKEYFVQGFPTLLLFRNGVKVEDYDGGRTSGEIIEYMRKQADPGWKPPPSTVLTLTQDNFTKTAKTKDLMLVWFYAPWCKHCKQLEPEMEGAANELDGWGITIAKVDGTREKELADQYNVAGWPTLKMFRKGRVYEYNGPREKQNIIDFMKDQSKLPSAEKSHMLGVTNNMDRLETTVVGFFKGKSDLYDEFIVAANEMRGSYRFLHTFDEEIAKSFNVPGDTVTVYQPEIYYSEFENKTFSLSKKSATYKEIIQFIRKSSIPLVGQRTKQNMNFKYPEKPIIVLYYDVNYDHQFLKDTQFIRKKILEIAKHFTDSNLKFAISNEDEFEDELKSLGLEDSGADVNVACYTDKQKFRMEPVEDDFEATDLAKFIEDLRTGKVKPFMKSMPVPKKQEGVIRKVVAHNYDEEIHKVKKDAVMFFYAPWCGHCKEFDPVFKKVAKKMLKNNENIVFGKMDGSSNDIPYMFPPLKGFPSVFFVSAYEKYDPILYQGDRTYKSVKDWINRHSSIFLTDDEKNGEGDDDDDEMPELPEVMESYQDEDMEDNIAGAKDTEEIETPSKDEL